MFIKKDLRKIAEIIDDPSDAREYLKLSKRQPEFQGSLRCLLRESKIDAFDNLKVLNLYDNALTSVQGIGMLAQTPVEDINLGGNKLTSLPLEFGTLGTMKFLWLDDNEIETFPICICQLKGLQTLRMPGNRLTELPMSIISLDCLETLALDNNDFTEFPESCLALVKLKHLWLRQNKLIEIPETIDSLVNLETLSVSSNKLTALPACVSRMHRLKNLYANGNAIEEVSSDLVQLTDLVNLNMANNKILTLPSVWKETWGGYCSVTGNLVMPPSSTIMNAGGKSTLVKLLGNSIPTSAQ